MQSRLLLYFLTTHAFKISTPRPLCAKEAHAVQSGQALQTVLKNRQCVQAGCGNVQDGSSPAPNRLFRWRTDLSVLRRFHTDYIL